MTTLLFLMVFSSALIHAAWNVAAKRVAGNIGVMWIGQLFAAVALMPLALTSDVPSLADGGAWIHIAFCGFLQVLYFFFLSKAYEHGDLSIVYPIARGLGVAGAALAGFWVFYEPISTRGALGITCIVVGSLVLGLGQLALRDRKALVFATSIGVTLAAGGLNDKLAVATVDPIFYIFCMFALAVVMSAPMALTSWRPHVLRALRTQKLPATIVGLGSMGGYLIILFAFQRGPLGYIVAFREMSVVLGALLGFFVFHEVVRKRKILGIAIIVFGLVLIKLA